MLICINSVLLNSSAIASPGSEQAHSANSEKSLLKKPAVLLYSTDSDEYKLGYISPPIIPGRNAFVEPSLKLKPWFEKVKSIFEVKALDQTWPSEKSGTCDFLVDQDGTIQEIQVRPAFANPNGELCSKIVSTCSPLPPPPDKTMSRHRIRLTLRERGKKCSMTLNLSKSISSSTSDN